MGILTVLSTDDLSVTSTMQMTSWRYLTSRIAVYEGERDLKQVRLLAFESESKQTRYKNKSCLFRIVV